MRLEEVADSEDDLGRLGERGVARLVDLREPGEHPHHQEAGDAQRHRRHHDRVGHRSLDLLGDAPFLPEVCGNAALLVDPDDPAGWIEAVRGLQTDQRLRRRMILRGYARARTYSWRNIAEIYLRLMAQADEVTLPHFQMRNCGRIGLDATRQSNQEIRPKKSSTVLGARQG